MNNENFIKSTLISAVFAIVIVVVLTVLGDLQPPLKNWMASTFLHHWIGKGILATVGFFSSLIIFSFFKLRFLSLNALIWVLVAVANGSVGLLALFYLYETFLK